MKIGLVSAAASALFALSTTALAQAPAAPARVVTTITTADYVEQRLDGNQVVTFPNDALKGDENSAYGFTIRRLPGAVRAGLIRPRVNFVSELLKSVENL
jgi:outer membrane receptor protein involved in Fe transport